MISRDFELYYYSDLGMNTLDMHSHDYYEFYLFLEGEVSIEIDSYPDDSLSEVSKTTGSRSAKKSTAGNQSGKDNKYQSYIKLLSPGDLILIPPGIKHHAVIHNPNVPYRRFVFWISRDYCQKLLEESVDYAYIFQQATSFKQYHFSLNPSGFHTVTSRLLRLLEETHSDHFGKNAAIHLCVCDIVLTLNRLIYDERNSIRGEDELSLFQNIISYIETNIEQSLSLDEIAGKFFVSKFYVSHLFKDTLGISPHQYILKKRLALCRDAIVSGATISTVYERYGFRDYSNFFKAFKKEYGFSPKEYQNMFSLIRNDQEVMVSRNPQ